MPHTLFLTNIAFPRRIVTQAGAVEIGNEVFFEIVGPPRSPDNDFSRRAPDASLRRQLAR
jgi:hypothetical protein